MYYQAQAAAIYEGGLKSSHLSLHARIHNSSSLF